jgi:dihydropteroate synthase
MSAPVSGPLLCAGRFRLTLARPLVMGIVNLTDDSFSDGGRYRSSGAAIEQAVRLREEGADILDLGAESTRPGAEPVSEQEELDRLLPVLEALRGIDCPLSIDTMKPGVMRAVLAAGASMINDVQALRLPGALEAVAASEAAVCLMHMQGEPRTMQAAPHYADVLAEVSAFLLERARVCRSAGIEAERIVLDPGYGFGKTVEHNLELLARQHELAALGYPLLAGLSRKSSIGRITGRAVGDRLAGSLAAALIALQGGARILRVHDVAATRDVVAVAAAVDSAARAHDARAVDTNQRGAP